MIEKLLTPEETGELLQVSVKSLANSRCSGIGITINYCKLGKFVRYKESDIQAYIDTNTYNQTSEAKKDV